MSQPKAYHLCLACAEVFPGEQIPATCPACGQAMEPARIRRLAYFGRNAFEYGYQYRNVFEADYAAERKCASRYQLQSFSEFMAFAAIAAASGILGNASYDLIKAVLQKIWRQARRRCEPKHTVFAELFESESGRRRFVEYIHDYTNGFVRLRNRAVKAAIEEEIFADLHINQRNVALNAAHPAETPREVDAAKQPEHLLAPSADHFASLWAAVEPEAPAKQPERKKRSRSRARTQSKRRRSK